MKIVSDYLVLGSGIAGLSFALDVAESGRVAVVTKRGLSQTATDWAQGGIAAVLDEADTIEAHVRDTVQAGCGLSKRSVAQSVIERGPDAIRRLLELGAHFSQQGADGPLDLAREGGHSARRVVHARDQTGHEIQRVLQEAVVAHPNIEIYEQHMAIDLIELSKFGGPHHVAGAYVLDAARGQVHSFLAADTVVAAGGAGKVYLYTSNPDVATGDGVAMAYRAGALVRNMEFFQFHPTCLFHPHAKTFLISEALRGEGGVLRSSGGEAFMSRHHPMKDLAPRDVVARAIDYEMKRTGAEMCLSRYVRARSRLHKGALPPYRRNLSSIWDRHHP